MMSELLRRINGYKVYGLVAIAIVVTVVNHFMPLPYVNLDPDNWLNDVWAQLLIAGGRSAVNKI